MANNSDKYFLIGLNGFKGVGKDTVGQILVDHNGFKRLAFADKLKQGVAELFGITVEDVDRYKEARGSVVDLWTFDSGVGPKIEMPWREFLQRFGTEMGRNVFGENFWVDQLLPLGHAFMYHQTTDIVVTDVRFENEINRIKEMGGYIIRIERPGIESDGHSSEIKPKEDLIDYTIWNTGNLNDLRAATHDMIYGLKDMLESL